MSSITLTDSFGFSMDATNGGQNANFFKRLLTDAEFVFDTANVKAAEMLPLGGDPEPNLPFTLTAKGSAGIGASGIACLKIDSTCTAKLSKSAGTDCSAVLKPFDETLPDGIDGEKAGYLSFETSAEVETAASGTVNEFTFGLTEGKTVTLSNSRFFPQLESIKLIEAARALLTDFVIPGEFSDLQFLPVQNICSVEGKGSLKFKGSVGYQFFTNPLTSMDIPVAGTLAIKACGNADLDFTVTLGAGFKISLLKNDDHTVRLSVERSRDIDFDTGIEVKAQVTATVMGEDLLSLLLPLISPNADQEVQQMNAKLDGDSRAAINDAIKSAIQNNFELALQGEIGTALKKDTVSLYELDLNALSDRGKAALQSAFQGDFTQLSEAAAAHQDGVTELHSVVTNTTTTTQKLTVHLLNVFQAGSVSALISKETVTATPGGDLAITDTATAHNIDFFSLGKMEGLRKVLFTSAMITSAYKGTKTQLGAPDLSCELVHFHYDQKAGVDELQHNLNALQVLQLISDDQAASALDKAKKQKPAPATINMSLKLSADDCARLFLDGNKARPADVYESAGKSAMYRLIANDPTQAGLAQVLMSESADLWNKLKAADTLDQAAEALGDASDTLHAAPYFSEVSRIKWWTQHMSALAGCVEAFQSPGLDADPNSSAFEKLHKALNSEAKNVSSLSEDYFNLPWGIFAMSQLLGASSKVDVTFVSQPFSIQVSAPAEAAKLGAVG